jgi:predicted 2-oxoglutarate/Fe(II)-dependent dioxygenase YbiX
MCTSRYLWDDTTKRPVLSLLPCQSVRQNNPVTRDQRRRRFITTRFNAKDQRHRAFL